MIECEVITKNRRMERIEAKGIVRSLWGTAVADEV